MIDALLKLPLIGVGDVVAVKVNIGTRQLNLRSKRNLFGPARLAVGAAILVSVLHIMYRPITAKDTVIVRGKHLYKQMAASSPTYTRWGDLQCKIMAGHTKAATRLRLAVQHSPSVSNGSTEG